MWGFGQLVRKMNLNYINTKYVFDCLKFFWEHESKIGIGLSVNKHDVSMRDIFIKADLRRKSRNLSVPEAVTAATKIEYEYLCEFVELLNEYSKPNSRNWSENANEYMELICFLMDNLFGKLHWSINDIWKYNNRSKRGASYHMFFLYLIKKYEIKTCKQLIDSKLITKHSIEEEIDLLKVNSLENNANYVVMCFLQQLKRAVFDEPDDKKMNDVLYGRWDILEASMNDEEREFGKNQNESKMNHNQSESECFDDNGRNALWYYASHDNVAKIFEILKIYPNYNAFVCDNDGKTTFSLAMEHNNLEFAMWLIRKAPLDMKTPLYDKNRILDIGIETMTANDFQTLFWSVLVHEKIDNWTGLAKSGLIGKQQQQKVPNLNTNNNDDHDDVDTQKIDDWLEFHETVRDEKEKERKQLTAAKGMNRVEEERTDEMLAELLPVMKKSEEMLSFLYFLRNDVILAKNFSKLKAMIEPENIRKQRMLINENDNQSWFDYKRDVKIANYVFNQLGHVGETNEQLAIEIKKILADIVNNGILNGECPFSDLWLLLRKMCNVKMG